AELEFWRTYMPYQSFDFLDKMDKALKSRLDSEKSMGGDSTEKAENPSGEASLLTTGSDAPDTTNQANDTTSKADSSKNEDLLSNFENGNDSNANDTAAKTFEQFKEERPLFAALNNGVTASLNVT